jgi:ankyrin repeat protein
MRLGQRDLFKFIKACWSGEVDLVKQRLRDGVDPNVQYENTGRGPLSAAAAGGHAAVAKLLLDAGADPNLPDSWKAMPPNGTPLENACANGHLAVAKLLLDRGAEVNRRGHKTPLWMAAAHGHPEVVELLLRSGASFDNSAFLKAVWAGMPKTVALLLDAGADANDRDADGEAPAHTAAIHESADVMKLLIAAGADVHAATHLQKQTPLHVAARYGRLDVIRALVDAGASVDALNHKKKTPEQWARLFEHPEAADLLKSHRGGRGGTDARRKPTPKATSPASTSSPARRRARTTRP